MERALVQLWAKLPWYHKRALSLAIIVKQHIERVGSMGKAKVAYLLGVMLLVSFTGVIIFIVRGNALMAAAFGGILGATLIGGAAFLVWYYFS